MVLSSGLLHGYENRDNGDLIEYCSPVSKDKKNPTRGAVLLGQSLKLNREIRVLRAHTLKSDYAPIKGLRYDGLYRITGKEVLNAETFAFRFKMRRIDGQEPIRCGQGVEARPTRQELAEYRAARIRLGLK